MKKRIKHPNKEIEAAIQFAELKGWRYREAGKSAHAWGRLLCFLETRDGCSMSIWSTPKDMAIALDYIIDFQEFYYVDKKSF